MTALKETNTVGVDQIRECLESLGEAEWVREMIEYYRENGRFRPEDVRRLLGDPTQSVEIGPSASLPKFFAVS